MLDHPSAVHDFGRPRRLVVALTVALAAVAIYWFAIRAGGKHGARPEAGPEAGQRRPSTGGGGLVGGGPSIPGGGGPSDGARVALDCAQPVGAAATVDDLEVTVARLCERLGRIGGVDAARTTVAQSQARAVLDQLIDATLVHRALLAAGATVAAAEVDDAMAALGPAAQTDPGLVREQLLERLELDQLLASRGRVEVSQQELDDELARGAPGIDPGAGALPIAPADAQERARLSAQAFADQVADGGDATSARPPLVALAPFVLGDDGIEPTLEAAVRGMEPGQWTGAVHTRAGWLVVRMLGRVEPTPIDAAFKDRVRAALGRRRLQAERQAMVASLRAAARLELRLQL